jgi:PAS domain S-box-containing protein
LSIIAGGYAYYRNFEKEYRDEVHHQLAAIADLKVSELSRYRRERLADAYVLHNDPSVTRLVRLFLGLPADVDAQKQLEKLLGKYQASYDYDKIRLLDVHGVTRLSVPAGSLQPVSRAVAASAATSLRTGQPVFQDFYRSETDQRVYLALLVPVFDETDGHRPLGVLFLRIDPAAHLYPFISRWPVPSKTAETLLIRREGEDAVFLNDLRFKTNAALSLRIPLTRTNNPAVRAALGHGGVVEGIDYRGVPVLAAVRAVHDSPWFLVARRDSAEILAPLHQIFWQVLLVAGILLFGAGAGVALVFRQQRIRFYRTRAEIGESLLQSEALRNEAEKLGRVGGWEIDIATRQLTWTETVYDIHELDRTVRPTVEQGVNFYVPESRSIIEQAVQRAIERGEPFDVELEIITAKGNRRNVHAIGKADQARRKVSGFFQDITERKRAEAAIISTKAFLDMVIDMSPFAMWISDKAGTVIRTNRSLCETINLADEKIIGKYNVLEDKNLEIQGVMPQVRAVFEKHEPARFNIPWKAVSAGDVDFRGGRDMYIDVSMFPIQNEQNELTNVVCQWIDITELKQAEEEAKAMQAETQRLLAAAEQSRAVLLSVVEDQQRTEEARQRFFLLAESSSEFICMCDLELQPLYVNPAGQRMVGLPDMEAACRVKVPDYFFPEDQAFIADEFFPRVLRDGHDDVEIRLRHFQTGEPIWVYYYLFSVKDATGKPIGWATVGHDITERRKAEAEIRQLNAELEQRVRDRTAELEAANQELEAFSYSVSHDLRAPLRAIDGFDRILVEDYADRLDDEGRRVLGVISRETQRMGQLIDDLLAFSRLSRQPMQLTEVHLKALAQAEYERCAAQEPDRRIEFKLHPLPSVQADAAMLRQVLANLLSNAVKFTRPREAAVIEIGVMESRRDEDIPPLQSSIAFFVRDNGVGFDMKYVETLFGVFQRLHSTEEFEGTGVGLALVQRVIRRHGGRVWAEGKVNEGAAFYFSLPDMKGGNHEQPK